MESSREPLRRGGRAAAALLLVLAGCSPSAEPSRASAGRPAGSASAPTAPASPPAQAKEAQSANEHLAIRDQSFWKGGTRFDWRGITAFRLPELIAHGRESEAVAFLDWAAARELTVVRVLLMARHLFQLSPDEGLRAAARLLELAAARGLHVELVALADTAHVPVNLKEHVTAVGELAAAHPNSLVEIGNEPWHQTQNARLHDPSFVQSLAELIPGQVPVALGSVEGDPGYAAADYVTWHAPRGSGDEGWQHVLQLAEGPDLVSRWGKPLVSDEPIGAGTPAVPGRRDDSPARFAAAAALTRLAGVHPTFHYESGLQAAVPVGKELESLNAWLAGLELMEDLPAGGKFLRGSELREHAEAAGVRALFGRLYDRELWIAAIDPTAEAAITLKAPWTLSSERHLPGVRVVRARREAAGQEPASGATS